VSFGRADVRHLAASAFELHHHSGLESVARVGATRAVEHVAEHRHVAVALPENWTGSGTRRGVRGGVLDRALHPADTTGWLGLLPGGRSVPVCRCGLDL